MKFFTCLLDPTGHGISAEMRRAYESLPRTRGLVFKWQSAGSVAVLTGWDDSNGDPLVAEDGSYFAVGTVRLDNRDDLEREVDNDCKELTDLEVVLHLVAQHGTRHIPQLLGDFAFVVWNGKTRTAIVACDALGAKKLYYAERDGLFAFASRAEALSLEERYEVRYLVELLLLDDPSNRLTVYAGVRPVPAASMAVLGENGLAFQQYWDVAGFQVESRWAKSEHEAIETCRQLLARSVRLRLGAKGETWAQLSGGLDSSSVVSLIQWLAARGEIAHGLAGTVTYVDRQGTAADEREYSDAVVKRWGVKNTAVVDSPTWHEDGHAPPRPDQPRFDLLFYPRNRRLAEVVRTAGGRVLLTGWGGDELFMGSMLFFADWIAHGRVWAAIREMARRAAIGRVSFWELAYRNALIPLLPRPLQHQLTYDHRPIQPWLNRSTLQQYKLTSRAPIAAEYAGPFGHKYSYAAAVRVARLAHMWNRDGLADFLDVRHPFLYRPLVEFALRLPPELRARPYAHRWVVREAMRGVLPELIRTRVGKPETSDILAWCLKTQRATLTSLLQEPILADLGVLDGAELRVALDFALDRTGRGQYAHPEILSALAVEAWLQMRSGRWPRGGSLGSTEVVAQN